MRINNELVRALREARDWDQQELAKRSGVDQSLISRMEAGLQTDFRLSGVCGVARALSVSLDDIVLPPSRSFLEKLTPDLASVLSRVADLPAEHQHRVAVILAAYLTTVALPPTGSTSWSG